MIKQEENSTDFLARLRLGESKAIRKLYEQSFHSCAKMVLNNSGSMEDAQDVFQEGIMVFIKKLNTEDFVLSAAPSTFIFAVVRNLWLKQLRKRGKKATLLILDDDDQHFQIADEDLSLEHQEKEAKHLAIETAMKTLSPECQEIILYYYFHKLPLTQIAERLDYSQKFIRVKKKRCMDTLKAEVFKPNKTP